MLNAMTSLLRLSMLVRDERLKDSHDVKARPFDMDFTLVSHIIKREGMNMKIMLPLVVLLICQPSFAEQNPLSAEAKRLYLEGWDMRLCRQIPISRYRVPSIDSDKIPVTFKNDTPTSVLPAYANLKGEVKFLKNERLAGAEWKDTTLIGNYYIWFAMPDRKCLGTSLVLYEWSSEVQKVSELAIPN